MNEVERVYSDLKAISVIVAKSEDVSAIAAFEEHSAKALLFAGASYFERRTMAAVAAFTDEYSKSTTLSYFAWKHTVERKFFWLFDFSADAKNINSFLGKFGTEFADWAKADLVGQGIDSATQIGFLNFCRLRNSLAHENYATYSIDKTTDDVKSAFDLSLKVVGWIESAFKRFEMQKPADPPTA